MDEPACWIVTDPEGQAVPDILRQTEIEAQMRACNVFAHMCMDWSPEDGKWGVLYRRGYRCKKVRIVEVDGE